MCRNGEKKPMDIGLAPTIKADEKTEKAFEAVYVGNN